MPYVDLAHLLRIGRRVGAGAAPRARLPSDPCDAVAKVEAFGDQLGTPRASQVKGSRAGIRELRPRSGH
ncbi:MAG TPA: hypothetical protein VLW50_26520 [Streptosporangiaceae bacterium]|nr:hypothetical protein [Streptosporangiaceae bacterium]